MNPAMMRLLVRRLRSENTQAYRAVLVEGLILHPDRFVEDYRAEVARPLTDIKADLEQNGMFGAWVDEKLVGIAGYSRLRSPKRQTLWKSRDAVRKRKLSKEWHRRQAFGRRIPTCGNTHRSARSRDDNEMRRCCSAIQRRGISDLRSFARSAAC